VQQLTQVADVGCRIKIELIEFAADDDDVIQRNEENVRMLLRQPYRDCTSLLTLDVDVSWMIRAVFRCRLKVIGISLWFAFQQPSTVERN